LARGASHIYLGQRIAKFIFVTYVLKEDKLEDKTGRKERLEDQLKE
jgi:hypothetical protein